MNADIELVRAKIMNTWGVGLPPVTVAFRNETWSSGTYCTAVRLGQLLLRTNSTSMMCCGLIEQQTAECCGSAVKHDVQQINNQRLNWAHTAYQHFLGQLERWDSYKIIYLIHNVRSATTLQQFPHRHLLTSTSKPCPQQIEANGARASWSMNSLVGARDPSDDLNISAAVN